MTDLNYKPAPFPVPFPFLSGSVKRWASGR